MHRCRAVAGAVAVPPTCVAVVGRVLGPAAAPRTCTPVRCPGWCSRGRRAAAAKEPVADRHTRLLLLNLDRYRMHARIHACPWHGEIRPRPAGSARRHSSSQHPIRLIFAAPAGVWHDTRGGATARGTERWPRAPGSLALLRRRPPRASLRTAALRCASMPCVHAPGNCSHADAPTALQGAGRRGL